MTIENSMFNNNQLLDKQNNEIEKEARKAQLKEWGWEEEKYPQATCLLLEEWSFCEEIAKMAGDRIQEFFGHTIPAFETEGVLIKENIPILKDAIIKMNKVHSQDEYIYYLIKMLKKTKKESEIDINNKDEIVLSYDDKEYVKEWIRAIVGEWHERVNPDFIFLNDTSATIYGYPIKEAWKKAYPNEKTPTFYRINSFFIREKEIEIDDVNLDIFLKKRILKENPKILIYDETPRTDRDENFPNLGRLRLYSQKLVENHEDFKDFYGLSLKMVALYITEFMKRNNIQGDVWCSDQNLANNPIETDIETKDDCEISRNPVSKFYHYGSRKLTEDEVILRHSPTGVSDTMLRGLIVKHPEQRKRALQFIKELKSIGKEAGKELHTSKNLVDSI